MASGKLSPTHTILSGNISSSSQHSLKGTVAGSDGSTDHNRLANRDKVDQQSITATIKSQDTLAIKVNEE